MAEFDLLISNGEDRDTGGPALSARLHAVLYPTTSLRIAGLTDAELATALCRAYNDWLAD
jgi:hypothetical protein